jgi:hypothetical protein
MFILIHLIRFNLPYADIMYYSIAESFLEYSNKSHLSVLTLEKELMVE